MTNVSCQQGPAVVGASQQKLHTAAPETSPSLGYAEQKKV